MFTNYIGIHYVRNSRIHTHTELYRPNFPQTSTRSASLKEKEKKAFHSFHIQFL